MIIWHAINSINQLILIAIYLSVQHSALHRLLGVRSALHKDRWSVMHAVNIVAYHHHCVHVTLSTVIGQVVLKRISKQLGANNRTR